MQKAIIDRVFDFFQNIFGHQPVQRNETMTQDEAVQQAMSSMQEIFGQVYQAGAGSVTPEDGVTQADVDAANAKAAADLQAAHDEAAADLKALQDKFDSLSSKEAGESKIIKGLEDSIDTLQESFGKLKSAVGAILSPAPVVEQPPVDQPAAGDDVPAAGGDAPAAPADGGASDGDQEPVA